MRRRMWTGGFAAVLMVITATDRIAAQERGKWDPATAVAVQAANAAKRAAARAVRIKEAAAFPTPRAADGRPDMSGYWGEPYSDFNVPVVKSDDGKTVTFLDFNTTRPERAGLRPEFVARAEDASRRPPYKPELVAKQRELMYASSLLDPGVNCYPLGVPRIGAPTEIVQTPRAVYLLYAQEEDTGDPTHDFRVVRVGGKHDPDADPTPNGDSIGRWEGDTFVIDTVNLDDTTWLDGDGDFHTSELRVTERLTRKGNTLDYEVIIEDPGALTAPWKPIAGRYGWGGRLGATTRILGPASEHSRPGYACVEMDRSNKVNTDRF